MPEKQESLVEATPEESEKKEEEVTKEEKKDDADEKKVAEEPPKEMRAVVLTAFGGLKSVKTQKKPEATPGEGEILIKFSHW
jgi:hypothetical protein